MSDLVISAELGDLVVNAAGETEVIVDAGGDLVVDAGLDSGPGPPGGPGPAGNMIRLAVGPPDDSLGNDGDYVLVGAPDFLWGPKTNGSWYDGAVQQFPLQGPPGPPGEAFRFDQDVPASTWTIVHNLASFPSVTVVDGSGHELDATVTYVDNNTIQLGFTVAVAGSAFLN